MTIASVVAVGALFVVTALGVGWVVFRTGDGVATSTPARFGPASVDSTTSAGPAPAAEELAATPPPPTALTAPTEPTAADTAVIDPDLVITPVEADAVLRSYWRRHEPALVSRDLDRLGELSTGTARIWERGAVACGCYQVDGPRPLQGTAYFIPRQTRHPAFFVVQVRTTTGPTAGSTGSTTGPAPWVEVLVFTQQAAGARWLVAHTSGFGPPVSDPEPAAPRAEADGYLRPLTAATTAAQRRRARTAAAELARFWQQAKELGTVPLSTQFQVSGQALGRVRWVAQSRQDELQVNGYLGRYRFFVDSDAPRYEVAEASGALLVCQVVRETVVYRSDQGTGRIRQDRARKYWGDLLEPGSYRTVTVQDYWQTCFRVPRDPQAPITILNQDVGGSVPRGE
jgi:hypothetical protein